MITFKEQQKKDLNEFLRTTKNHKISICQNTKLFTHIKVKQPNTNNRSYEIIIIPGYLFFIGDMGSYTFKKTFDMKNFHRISWDKQPIISYDKLAKACQSIDKFGDVTEFNNAAFKLEARKCLRDSLQGNPQYRDHYRDFKSAVLDQDFPTYKEAMFNLSSWYYIGPEGTRENPFDDFYDNGTFQETSSKFKWACWAIAYAIKEFDAIKPGTIINNQDCEVDPNVEKILNTNVERKNIFQRMFEKKA